MLGLTLLLDGDRRAELRFRAPDKDFLDTWMSVLESRTIAAQKRGMNGTMEGWLEKEGGGTTPFFGSKDWKRRFFRLEEGVLSYSEGTHYDETPIKSHNVNSIKSVKWGGVEGAEREMLQVELQDGGRKRKLMLRSLCTATHTNDLSNWFLTLRKWIDTLGQADWSVNEGRGTPDQMSPQMEILSSSQQEVAAEQTSPGQVLGPSPSHASEALREYMEMEARFALNGL